MRRTARTKSPIAALPPTHPGAGQDGGEPEEVRRGDVREGRGDAPELEEAKRLELVRGERRVRADEPDRQQLAQVRLGDPRRSRSDEKRDQDAPADVDEP